MYWSLSTSTLKIIVRSWMIKGLNCKSLIWLSRIHHVEYLPYFLQNSPFLYFPRFYYFLPICTIPPIWIVVFSEQFKFRVKYDTIPTQGDKNLTKRTERMFAQKFFIMIFINMIHWEFGVQKAKSVQQDTLVNHKLQYLFWHYVN